MDDVRATAIHEAAHAVVSCALGIPFEYVEVSAPREGVMMPMYSPCSICGAVVPEYQACQPCLAYFEKNRPTVDARSAMIERFYREEAAIAVAGEVAERHLAGGVVLSGDDELAWDRNRVRTRASLRHLWSAASKPCINYCRQEDPCDECDQAVLQLETAAANMIVSSDCWSAIDTLANRLANGRRLTGKDVIDLLTAQGMTCGGMNINNLWPRLD